MAGDLWGLQCAGGGVGGGGGVPLNMSRTRVSVSALIAFLVIKFYDNHMTFATNEITES